MGILGQAAGFLGIMIYQRYLRNVGVRLMLFWTTIICAGLSLIGEHLHTSHWDTVTNSGNACEKWEILAQITVRNERPGPISTESPTRCKAVCALDLDLALLFLALCEIMIRISAWKGIMLYTRTNQKLGIPDVPFLLTDSTLTVVILTLLLTLTLTLTLLLTLTLPLCSPLTSPWR